MRPYYSEAGIEIWHGDCREVLPSLAPDSADLIVTDPPYGVNWQSNARARRYDLLAGDDGCLDVRGIIESALRVLGRYRHLYVFGPDVFSGIDRIVSGCELIWDKSGVGMGDLTLPWGVSHERIGFGVYVPERSNRSRGAGRLAARLRKGSVIRCVREDGKSTSHPTEKPVPLIRQLIESSSSLGETVLDLFAGSGSTLVAASLEGRKAIGIELEEKYCEIAAKRLAQGALPMEFSA